MVAPPMITVTEETKRILHAVARAALPEGQNLRLETSRTSGTGAEKLAMLVDEPKEGDEPVEHEGEPFLYVSRRVSEAYDGCVMDLEHTPQGLALSIGPPLAGRDARSQGSP
jgi:Fe-S cluster assembly iron-binding protein IscA